MSANKTKEEIAEDDDEPMIVTLEYDDGTEVETEVMGVFEVEGKEYIALLPDDGSDDVYLYGYSEIGGEDGDEFELLDIEDEEEFDKVVAAFDELMEFDGEEE
ncbi:hypothetical protein AGMMS49983_02050 [Clostridia bacterium]|nr:hypothetical protein AGMMS49983_02050 [Clostridia bacterium]